MPRQPRAIAYRMDRMPAARSWRVYRHGPLRAQLVVSIHGQEAGMVSKRGAQQPWMTAPAYGQSLQGMSINLLVRDVPRSVVFQRDVLGAVVVYSDADIAVLRRDMPGAGVEWMLHADHTYGNHPLLAITGDGALRGAGVEFRLHHCDPDAVVAAADRLGYTVLV
ncbi:MAG: hypothetical protein ACREE7_06765, partial [Dongiaceae bacterium]